MFVCVWQLLAWRQQCKTKCGMLQVPMLHKQPLSPTGRPQAPCWPLTPSAVQIAAIDIERMLPQHHGVPAARHGHAIAPRAAGGRLQQRVAEWGRSCVWFILHNHKRCPGGLWIRVSHGAPTLANIECQEEQQRLTSTSTTRAVSAAGSTTSSSLLGAGKRGLPAAGASQWEPQPPSGARQHRHVEQVEQGSKAIC